VNNIVKIEKNMS